MAKSSRRFIEVWSIPFLIAATAPGIAYLLFPFWSGWPGWIISVAVLAVTGWMDHQFTHRQQTALAVRLEEARQEHAATHKRLQAVLDLSHQLAESPDERSLMDAALSTLTNLVDGLGCSFIPLDEWNQPLPAFTFGRLPNPVMQSWSAYQDGSVLLERCGNCNVLKSVPGGCPLHPEVLGSSMAVVCLPLYQPETRGVKTSMPRRLGISEPIFILR